MSLCVRVYLHVCAFKDTQTDFQSFKFFVSSFWRCKSLFVHVFRHSVISQNTLSSFCLRLSSFCLKLLFTYYFIISFNIAVIYASLQEIKDRLNRILCQTKKLCYELIYDDPSIYRTYIWWFQNRLYIQCYPRASEKSCLSASLSGKQNVTNLATKYGFESLLDVNGCSRHVHAWYNWQVDI